MNTVRVIDNNTHEVIAMEQTFDTTKAMVIIVDRMKRKYTNGTVEFYYGEPNGKPITTERTFH